MQGTIFSNRYLIAEEIGAGGMGNVYRATDLRTGGEVAVKVPHAFLTRNPEYMERLRREAQIAASIYSPRVVRVIDLDTHEGQPYLVMEYVPGETLSDVLEEKTLPLADALRTGMDVARALDAAHAKGIVHRDLKPQNIKLVDGEVKVLDFGIAKAEGLPGLTSASIFMGTPEYAAPERLEGLGDIRSDLYSLGAILYQLVTGDVPYSGPTPMAVMHKQLTQPLPPLSDDTPITVRSIVRRCLEKDPADRYRTPAELVSDLLAAIREVESATSDTASSAALPQQSAESAPRSVEERASGAITAVRPHSETPTVNVLPSGAITRPHGLPAGGASLHSRRVRRLAVGGAVLAAVLIAIIAAFVVRANRSSGGDEHVAAAPGTVAANLIGTEVPAAAPTAAPATISDLKAYRSGQDFLTGQPPASELAAGGDVVACFAYDQAGRETSLVVAAFGPNDGSARAAQTEPFTPPDGASVRCELLPGASGLAPGQYALTVEDRAQERTRGVLTLVQPTPPPTPAPSPVTTPAAPPAPSLQPAAPLSTAPPTTPRPASTAAPAPQVQPVAPQPTTRPIASSQAQPQPSAVPPQPTPAPPAPSAPPPTPRPTPVATLRPGG